MGGFTNSGTGGRSSGVNYATAALFDQMRWRNNYQNNKQLRYASLLLATTYQAVTGASGGSLKRLKNYIR